MSGPWYRDGIRFSCRRCGECCRTEPGSEAYVYLSGDDIRRLAAALGISEERFRNEWTEVRRGQRILRDPDKDCPFLRPDGCAVYEARPMQCRTWPFWECCLTERGWREKVLPYCPGARAGDGRLYRFEEIERIKEESPL